MDMQEQAKDDPSASGIYHLLRLSVDLNFVMEMAFLALLNGDEDIDEWDALEAFIIDEANKLLEWFDANT
jgi:hypothetical protein